MEESRARYRQAIADAGPDFSETNPGKHFYYELYGQQVCVFCGSSQESIEAATPEVACTGPSSTE